MIQLVSLVFFFFWGGGVKTVVNVLYDVEAMTLFFLSIVIGT